VNLPVCMDTKVPYADIEGSQSASAFASDAPHMCRKHTIVNRAVNEARDQTTRQHQDIRVLCADFGPKISRQPCSKSLFAQHTWRTPLLSVHRRLRSLFCRLIIRSRHGWKSCVRVEHRAASTYASAQTPRGG